MTNSPVGRRWGGTAVALLTTVWVLALLASVWRIFGIGMRVWADGQSNSEAHSAELHHQASAAAMMLVGVTVGGPLVIAGLAFAVGMARTGGVYIVLTIVFGVLAITVVAVADRAPGPSVSPPSAPTVCQEHSGGDNECPGG